MRFSQSAIRFHLTNIWSTNLRSMILAAVVHCSSAKNLSRAEADHPSRSIRSYGWQANLV